MRSLLATIAAAFWLFVAAVPQAQSVDIWVMTNNTADLSGVTTSFGRIDVASGVYTQLASINGAAGNLTYAPGAPGSSYFYYTLGAGDTASLRRITKLGVDGGNIGTIAGLTADGVVNGMAYRPANDTIYAYQSSNLPVDRLGTINRMSSPSFTNLTTEPIGGDALDPFGGRITILNDQLFGSFYDGSIAMFAKTNGFTAGSVFTPTISTDARYRYMTLAGDTETNTLYGIYGNGSTGQQQLYTIDPATGVLTAGALITGVNLGTYFHAAAIPEPSTYVLCGIGTAAFCAIARRRKSAAKA
jgi:hypothetical protein